MKNIREYFDSLLTTMNPNDVLTLEERAFGWWANNDKRFWSWAADNNIDLAALDSEKSIRVLTIWTKEMSEDF